MTEKPVSDTNYRKRYEDIRTLCSASGSRCEAGLPHSQTERREMILNEVNAPVSSLSFCEDSNWTHLKHNIADSESSGTSISFGSLTNAPNSGSRTGIRS